MGREVFRLAQRRRAEDAEEKKVLLQSSIEGRCGSRRRRSVKPRKRYRW